MAQMFGGDEVSWVLLPSIGRSPSPSLWPFVHWQLRLVTIGRNPVVGYRLENPCAAFSSPDSGAPPRPHNGLVPIPRCSIALSVCVATNLCLIIV